jgi:hypothetical protein
MFSKKRQLFSAIAIACLTIGGLLYVYASTRNPRRSAQGRQNANRPQAKDEQHVQRALIWQQLRPALNQLGDRLEQRGKERLSIAGTISSADTTAPQPLQLVLEYPEQVRISRQTGISGRVITFNGNAANESTNRLEPADLDLIQSVLYDSAERFFLKQSSGIPTRALGNHFRNDDGSYDDIYQVLDRVSLGPDAKDGIKFFCFESNSQLLSRVRYDSVSGGITTKVETRLSNWQKLGDQRLPGTISRFENGQLVFTLNLSTTVLGPHANDGILNR